MQSTTYVFLILILPHLCCTRLLHPYAAPMPPPFLLSRSAAVCVPFPRTSVSGSLILPFCSSPLFSSSTAPLCCSSPALWPLPQLSVLLRVPPQRAPSFRIASASAVCIVADPPFCVSSCFVEPRIYHVINIHADSGFPKHGRSRRCSCVFVESSSKAGPTAM